MNSALLLGQVVLLVALVPSIYLANYYYKAYYEEREKRMAVNGVLVYDKMFLVDELAQLRDKLNDTARNAATVEHHDLLSIVASKIHLVLDGDKRRLAEARRRVKL